MDNFGTIKIEYSKKQITEALKAHFGLPKDSQVYYPSKYVSGSDGDLQELSHVEVTFKKRIEEILRK